MLQATAIRYPREGSFGIVAKCRNTETTKIEAVKVNKSEEGVLEVAMDEIAILKRLRRLNPDTCNIVQCNGFFFDKENICISFELLDLSLQDYLQEKNPRGLTTRELRPILHQLATALSHLHSSGIIHADLKPPNVMVVNRHEQPLKVKLIDFGVARLVSAVTKVTGWAPSIIVHQKCYLEYHSMSQLICGLWDY
uniref:Protein kinase domain-containing protein n=1 Tax=Amphiprion percula TaxID=161767 RepID=A0A3P8SM07_AMPPE